MENVKQFVKNHKKEIILIGGVVTVGVIIKVLMANRNEECLEVMKDKDNIETVDSQPEGYDIWAIIGTKCSDELLNGIKELVASNDKTIYFEEI